MTTLDNVAIAVLSYGHPNPSGELISGLLAGGDVSPDQVLEVHNLASENEPVVPQFGCRLVQMDRNAGYAGGMNVALRELSSLPAEYVLLLTHDVRITPRAIAELRDTLAARPDVVCVGPCLTSGGRIWSTGKHRSAGWAHTHITNSSGDDELIDADSLDGSVLMFRATDVLQRRFDERFFMYYEETELLEGLIRATHGRVAVVSATRAESADGGPRRPLACAYLMARNGLEVAWRYGGPAACGRHALYLLGDSLSSVARETVKEAVLGGSQRRAAAARARARAAGARDFLARRFGPPPPSLSDGDLRL